jgi:CspA family cold shock protein
LVRTGRVLRYDEARGYGFIVPDGGGEDVFVHANELVDKSNLTSGTVVEFESMESDRGLKAFGVRVLSEPESRKPSPAIPALAPAVSRNPSPAYLDDLCDVLAPSEFQEDVTEVLLANVPDLTGAQILRIRDSLLTFATEHGWIESGTGKADG